MRFRVTTASFLMLLWICAPLAAQTIAGPQCLGDADGDAHVGEHRDHALDLLGVGHVVGQVVVDLGVREVAAVLAQDDQVLQALLLRLDFGELDLRLAVVVVVPVSGSAGFLHWRRSAALGIPAAVTRGRPGTCLSGKTCNSIKVLTAPQ